MTLDEQDLCVTMKHDDLTAAPVYELSPDYHVRWYTPGDEEIWVAIQKAADHYNTITKDLFFQQFPKETFALKDRQCYLCDRSSRAVATGTAWAETQGLSAGYGLVHWMAVLPEFQHRGIGKMLMSVICRRFIALGYKQACLRTSTLRPDAIALYRRFGFATASIERWS
jgi:GNAT superfamily N-acetyltransferase